MFPKISYCQFEHHSVMNTFEYFCLFSVIQISICEYKILSIEKCDGNEKYLKIDKCELVNQKGINVKMKLIEKLDSVIVS